MKVKAITFDLDDTLWPILPVIIRLANSLQENKVELILLFPDAGATALAKQKAPEISSYIYSFKEILEKEVPNIEQSMFLAVTPQPYDYVEFNQICDKFTNIILQFPNHRMVTS